jgi:hypothetical protein
MKPKYSKIGFTSILILAFTLAACLSPSVSFANAESSGRYSQCSLNVSVNLPGSGYITPNGGLFNYGDSVLVTEQTRTGFAFDGWYLNGVYQGKLSSIVVTMYKDNELIAVFSKRVVSLTLTVNPADTGTLAPYPGIWTYNYGDSVQVREFPNTGNTFDGWYLDGVYKGPGSTITVYMDGDHQLGAYYNGQNFTVVPSPTPIPTPTPIVTISPNFTASPSASPTFNPTPTVTPSPTATPTPLPSPSLYFTCKSSNAYSGFAVDINGNLTTNNVGFSGAGIRLSYSVTGGLTWNDLAYVITKDDGSFSAAWMLQVTGNYLINATWPGDEAYSRVSTVVSFAVDSYRPTPEAQQNVFSVASNSTLGTLVFDSVKKELSFGVSGPSGTTGYVSVYIPKTLIANSSALKVYLDNSTIAYLATQTEDSWLVSFIYSHSSHSIVMSLGESEAEPSPSGTTAAPTEQAQPVESPLLNTTLYIAIAAAAIAIVVVAVVVVVKKRKS